MEITAPLDRVTTARVQRKLLSTAAIVAILLMVLGELLRGLLHFSIGSVGVLGELEALTGRPHRRPDHRDTTPVGDVPGVGRR